MAGRFNSLTEYINSIESVEDKIKAMVDIHSASVTEHIVQSPNEFNNVLNSILFPTDNEENQPLHINKEESIKRLQMLFRLQGETHNQAVEERKMWRLYVEDKYKALNYSEEQKETITDFYHHMTSKANNEHSTVMSIYFLVYGSPSFYKLLSQLEDGEEIYEGIQADESNRNDVFALMQEKVMSEYGNSYSREFMVGDTIKHKDAGTIPGLNADKEKCVSQWIQFEQAATSNLPWMTPEEKQTYKMKVYGKVGVWTRDNAEIFKKMGQLNKIYKDMESNMKSKLWDSDSYKHTMNTLKAISEGYEQMKNNGVKLDDNGRARYVNLINETMKNAAEYVDSHITERATEKGKNRFNSAMLIIGVCNMDSATAVKEIVDKVRGRDSEQKVNLKASADKYKIVLDEPFACEWMKQREEVKNNPSYNRQLEDKINETKNEKVNDKTEKSGVRERISFSALAKLKKDKVAKFSNSSFGNRELKSV